MLFLALCSRPSDLSVGHRGGDDRSRGSRPRLLSTCEYLSTTHFQLLYIHIPVKSSQSSQNWPHPFSCRNHMLELLAKKCDD